MNQNMKDPLYCTHEWWERPARAGMPWSVMQRCRFCGEMKEIQPTIDDLVDAGWVILQEDGINERD